MRPEFEKFRGEKGRPKHAVNVLIPEELYSEVSMYASAEGDTVSGLVIEGAARVVLDRRADPNYAKNNAENVEDAKNRLRAELAMLERISAQSIERPQR